MYGSGICESQIALELRKHLLGIPRVKDTKKVSLCRMVGFKSGRGSSFVGLIGISNTFSAE